MNNKGFLKDKVEIARTLSAVVAGMLTDLLYDMLADEHFEGQILDGVIQINRISEYTTLQRIGIISVLFLALWVFFSYIVPLMSYCLYSLWHHNKPRINNKEVLNTYTECKEKIFILRERAQNMVKENDCACVVIFCDVCLLIGKLYNVFCSGKEQNERVIRNIFRTGSTVNDMNNRLSSYEYLAIIDIIQNTLTLSYNNASQEPGGLLESDYNNMVSRLIELKGVPRR